MLKSENINYFKHGKIENIKFWKRLGLKPDFKNKKILDFGCGYGSLTLEIAASGAQKVVGVDSNIDVINFAKENLRINFPDLIDKVDFEVVDLLKTDKFKDIDYIVTKDTFEHSLNLDQILEKFHQILKKDGKAFVGFGPLYNFYNGDHGRTEAILPWFHIIIPEKILINRLNKKYKKNIEKIEDLGLSKYSFKDYIRLFKGSKFEIIYFKTNFSDHPLSIIFNLLSKIKVFEEYCTYNIYSILKK